jgi:excisionase family DNA binding protein
VSAIDTLIAELTPDQLDLLAERLAPRLLSRMAAAPTEHGAWLSTKQAAEYLACSRGRLYDLVQLRKLEPRRDGRRLLCKRSDLDAYLEARS